MKIQLLFFLGICAITLHFSLRLGIDLERYCSLKKKSNAHIVQWEILEIDSGLYQLKADYRFEDQGEVCRGSWTFNPPYYLNKEAAYRALKAKAKEKWVVWYNPNHLAYNALEKGFPGPLLLRTLICYGVIIYFFILRRKFLAA